MLNSLAGSPGQRNLSFKLVFQSLTWPCPLWTVSHQSSGGWCAVAPFPASSLPHQPSPLSACWVPLVHSDGWWSTRTFIFCKLSTPSPLTLLLHHILNLSVFPSGQRLSPICHFLHLLCLCLLLRRACPYFLGPSECQCGCPCYTFRLIALTALSAFLTGSFTILQHAWS